MIYQVYLIQVHQIFLSDRNLVMSNFSNQLINSFFLNTDFNFDNISSNSNNSSSRFAKKLNYYPLSQVNYNFVSRKSFELKYTYTLAFWVYYL